jgi:Holliday junction DNA helicase RuvA
MFYYIKGALAYLSPTVAAVDAGGVAYKLSISGTTYNSLSVKGVGDEVKLFTYLAVREDAMELYGFASEGEHDTFEMLITVSGVGPKAALSILSALSSESLSIAISSGDWHSIARANGVGPKTAQRVVLELKDKVIKQFESGAAVSFAPEKGGAQSSASVISEAINALCVLGYTRAVASSAVAKASEPGLSVEDTITKALKLLSKQ